MHLLMYIVSVVLAYVVGVLSASICDCPNTNNHPEEGTQ